MTRKSKEISVIEAFSQRLKPLFVTEISETSGMPISTCFNAIKSLRSGGYLYSLGPRKGFYLTSKLTSMMNTVSAHDPLQKNISPYLEALRDRTRETVLFSQRIGAHAIMLLVKESPQNIRYVASIGDTVPAHSSSIGRSILSRMPQSQRNDVINESIRHSWNETRTLADINAIIEREEERGWHLGKGENDPDLCGISKAIKLHGQIFSVTISGPTHRIILSMDEHIHALSDICVELEGMDASSELIPSTKLATAHRQD